MPNEAMNAELSSELTSLEEAAPAADGIELLPLLLGAIPVLALGTVDTLLIRSDVEKVLEIVVPEGPSGSEALTVEWVAAGETWQFPSYHDPVAMPYDGFAVINGALGAIVAQTSASECGPPEAPAFPDGFQVLSWYWNDCFTGYGLPLAPVTAYALVTKPATAFPRPIEDYDGQSVDIAASGVEDPGFEVVEERLAAALDSGKYPILNQWLDHMLGGESQNPLCEPVPGATTVKVPAIMPGQTVEAYEDCLDTLGLTEHVRVTVPAGKTLLTQPARGAVGVEPAESTSVTFSEVPQVTVKINADPSPPASEQENVEACDRSTPTFPVVAPENDPTPEVFDVITDPALVASSTFSSLRGNTVLRWGRTRYLGTDERGDPDYDGWGYSHIAAKHGWSLEDDADTRVALRSVVFPSRNERTADGWDFFGPTYRQNSLTCTREVAVDFGTTSGEPAPRGIITSYGRDVTELPRFIRAVLL